MHPILFEIPTPWGDLPIYSYGVMLGTSLLVAWYFLMHYGVKIERMSRELMGNTFIITAISAIVGARLLYVFTNIGDFQSFGKWFQIREGGLVAYGGFLGGFLGSYVYLKLIKKVPLLPWTDLAAPTLGSGLAITRIGCWLYGCDYGRPLEEGAPGFLTNLGTFPKWDLEDLNGSPAYAHHMREYADRMGEDATASLPVHPTQIYESVAGVALFFFAFYLLTHRKFRGQVVLAVTIAYGVIRFGLEYVRDDPERGGAFGFSTSQLVSMLLVPLCVFAYVELRKRGEGAPLPAHAREPEPDSPKRGADPKPEPGAKTAGSSSKRSSGASSSKPLKKKKKKKRK